jgi:hypothetical protein
MTIPVIFYNPHVFFEEATKQNYTDAHDLFYRSMVEYLLDESIQYVCTFIYKDYEKYLFEPESEEDEIILSRDALLYFEYIEEYETCQLIFEVLESDN